MRTGGSQQAGRMSAVAPQDATMFWLSGRTRNDLFLLYCFDDAGMSAVRLREQVKRRSARIPDLRVRLREVPGDLDYPSWVPCEFIAEQFVEHRLPGVAGHRCGGETGDVARASPPVVRGSEGRAGRRSDSAVADREAADSDWPQLLAALGGIVATGVDATVRPWRVHIFRQVFGAPGMGAEPALVVVLQLSHALADGRRGAAIARALFSEQPEELPAHGSESCRMWSAVGERVSAVVGDLPAVGRVPLTEWLRAADTIGPAALATARIPLRLMQTTVRGYAAYRAQQELAQLTAEDDLPSAGRNFAPSAVNRAAPVDKAEPDERVHHRVRMLVYPADQLRVPGRTVTVVVLTAISVALSRYLELRGEPVTSLGAQVPMALPATSNALTRNNYRSLGVDLCLDEPDLRRRADRIAATLHARRTRALHPLLSAQDRVTEVVPAALLRRDIDRYPLDTVPDAIAGHTVVSSVHRGPADLSCGGGAVRFTAGFPAIGSVMRLTHGVHGIGDTVTVSVHADAAAVPDPDTYLELLRTALTQVMAM